MTTREPNNFFDDVELTDNLFDELLNELEFENYTNNEFVTMGKTVSSVGKFEKRYSGID